MLSPPEHPMTACATTGHNFVPYSAPHDGRQPTFCTRCGDTRFLPCRPAGLLGPPAESSSTPGLLTATQTAALRLFPAYTWTKYHGLEEACSRSRGAWTFYDGICDRAGGLPHVECGRCKTALFVWRANWRRDNAPTLIPTAGIRCRCDDPVTPRTPHD